MWPVDNFWRIFGNLRKIVKKSLCWFLQLFADMKYLFCLQFYISRVSCVLFFVYLLVIFILKELLLLTCKEIHFDFKLEPCKGTNRIFHLRGHTENVKWQLDIKTYRGRQQLQTGKQRQWATKMSASFFVSSFLFPVLNLLHRRKILY